MNTDLISSLTNYILKTDLIAQLLNYALKTDLNPYLLISNFNLKLIEYPTKLEVIDLVSVF